MDKVFICRNSNDEIYFSSERGLNLNIELLQNYLSPCFEIVESSQVEHNIDFHIISHSHNSNFKPIFETEMEPCLLHLSRCAHRKICKESLWVCYDNFPIAYYADMNGITMLSNLLSEVDYYDLVRLIMSIYELKQLAKGYIRCHMALLKIEDVVVAMIGDKNAGKTTFMCNFLNAKGHMISFGGNDKCYVKVIDDSLYALGAFEYVGIRNITNSCFIGLENNMAFEATDMKFYWPGSLIRFFKKDYLGKAKVDVIISPSIQMSQKNLERVKYELNYDVFEKIFFEFSDENHMNWLTKALIDIHSLDTSFISKSKKDIYKYFIANGIYQISGNPYNSDHLCAFIKESGFTYE